MSEQRAHKPAAEIEVGDYLPFKHQSRGQGETWWLEVVKVESKRTRVWLTVESRGERFVTRPGRDTKLAYKEIGDILAEEESSDA